LNQPVQARECFQHCLGLDPNHAPSHYQLGILYEQWNELELAYGHYKSAWQLNPKHSPYLLALAQTRLSQNRCEEAQQLLHQHTDPFGMDTAFYVTWGNIHLCQDNTEAAIERFRKAHNMNPDDAHVMGLLAMAYHKMGKVDEAMLLLQKLIQNAQQKSQPVLSSWYLALGDCYQEKGQVHQARRNFETFTRLEDANPVGWTRLAQVAFMQDQVTDAIRYARKALALEQNHKDALLVLGYAAMIQDDFITAQQHVQHVVRIDPENPLVYCLLGQVLEKQGALDKALACYGEAVRLDPKDSLAQKLLTNALQAQSAQHSSSKSY
jgi:tetratricopeptide (TPR) repeat protein